MKTESKKFVWMPCRITVRKGSLSLMMKPFLSHRLKGIIRKLRQKRTLNRIWLYLRQTLLDSEEVIREWVCREILRARVSTHMLILLTKKKWQFLQRLHRTWRKRWSARKCKSHRYRSSKLPRAPQCLWTSHLREDLAGSTIKSKEPSERVKVVINILKAVRKTTRMRVEV